MSSSSPTSTSPSMATETSSSLAETAAGPSESTATLPRGGACLPCRRRKMRCDGSKPACGQCVSKRREEDCEYTSELQGLTRTQMLEENIVLLESRIRELEDPAAASPSVRLHNAQRYTSTSKTGLPVLLTDVPVNSASIPGPTYSSAGHLTSSSSAQAQMKGLPQSAQSTVQESYTMINAFLPHASQVGFFLNVARFMQLAYTPPNSRDSFVDSLITTVCLWGSRLSRNAALSAFEAGLLSRAVHLVSGSLFLANTEPRGHGIIAVVQAEVLLSNYFFSLGRFLEGRYHCSAAASLAISCQLNVLGSTQNTRTQRVLAMDLVASLDLGLGSIAAADPIQAGERVNAFWTVFILDKMWTVATGTPSSITDQVPGGLVISTPWPLSMEMYEQQGHRAALTSEFSPVYTLLHSPSTANDLVGDTPLTLRAKASALFYRASLLATQYQDDMPSRDVFIREHNSLDNLISTFINNLPQPTTIARGDSCERLVAYTIARVASIQLHITFAPDQARSRERCLAAANAIIVSIQHVRASQLGFLDPIMAILMSSAGQVLITEMKALNRLPNNNRGPGQIAVLAASLSQVLNVMTDFGPVCPLMASQTSQIEEARSAIH